MEINAIAIAKVLQISEFSLSQDGLLNFTDDTPAILFTEHENFDEQTYAQELFLIGKEETKVLIAERHAQALALLSGGKSNEERDTWPNQKDWVRDIKHFARQVKLINVVKSLTDDAGNQAIVDELLDEIREDLLLVNSYLSGLLTDAETAELEAASLDPATFMASKITERVLAMNQLIITANKLKREGDAAVEATQTPEQLKAAAESLEAQMNAATSAYLASQ